jgi:hypothetical protein
MAISHLLRNDKQMKKSRVKRERKSAPTLRTLRIRGAIQPKLSDEFVVVRTQPSRASGRSPRSSEEAKTMIDLIGKALNTPGVSKRTIFKPGVDGLYAYSADLDDPKKIVRRSSNGKKVTGKLVQGRFKAG